MRTVVAVLALAAMSLVMGASLISARSYLPAHHGAAVSVQQVHGKPHC